MDPKNVVIIGYDAVSPLGTDLEIQWQRAADGESGIDRLTRFPIRNRFPVLVAGQVDEVDVSPYPFLSARALAQWRSPIFKYALLTVYRALERSGIEITPELAPRIGITFSTAVGGQDAVIEADRLLNADEKLPHPSTNPNSCINMVGGKVSILSGATGPITSTITACATGSTSVIIGSMMIQQGMADAVICGAVDFPLVEPIVAGFATMNGAYSCWEGELEEPPAAVSRPFSQNRKGFVVSEGSGAIIIASQAFAEHHNLEYEFQIAGWGMSSDAYHHVAPNLKTVRRCMQEAISHAGLTPSDIDVINAHAASTKVGDQVEFNAIEEVFGDALPPVSANKSMIGHAMGASSAIELIFGLEGMKRHCILPTINYSADPKLPLDCVANGRREARQEFLLKNAFGFGGCNACLVIKHTPSL